MDMSSEKTVKVKVFQKGQVVIPVALRRKHCINVGDHVEAVSTSEGILIKPGTGTKERLTLTERLFGIFDKYRLEKISRLKDSDISDATERGFVDEWRR